MATSSEQVGAACSSCHARFVSQMAIGQILVEEGHLTQAELDGALEIHRSTGLRLGRVLVDRALVSERQFAQTLALQLDLPFFDLDDYLLDEAVVSLVPDHLCERYRLVPLMKTGDRLLVAMADPANPEALADLSRLPGFTVRVVVATPSEVNRALERAFEVQAARQSLREKIYALPTAGRRMRGPGLPGRRPRS